MTQPYKQENPVVSEPKAADETASATTEPTTAEEAERNPIAETEPATVSNPEEPPTDASTVQKRGFALELKPWHIVIAACVVTALLVGSLFLGMSLSSGKGIDKGAVNYPWKPSSGAVGTERGIAIPGYESITLPAGECEVDLILPNPTDNPCNFWFTLTLVETGEELYRSGMIPPGMAVTKVTLSHALEVGDYTVVISIRTASVSDGVPMNGAALSVPLRVR